MIFSIADSCTPVYHSEILSIARDDIILAITEPEVFAFTGEHTAVNAIAANIYYRIVEHLTELAFEEGETE